MEYRSQPSADQVRKGIEKTLNTLTLKKDLQTALLLAFTLLLLVNYFNYHINLYITDLILPTLPDFCQKNIIMTVFQMLLPRMAIFNNLFKSICQSQIQLSEFIELL